MAKYPSEALSLGIKALDSHRLTRKPLLSSENWIPMVNKLLIDNINIPIVNSFYPSLQWLFSLTSCKNLHKIL